jgi:hypothetical protein
MNVNSSERPFVSPFSVCEGESEDRNEEEAIDEFLPALEVFHQKK